MQIRSIIVAALAMLFAAGAARANIYQWAWVNPSDETQGVYQTTTLCPGGAGASAAPSAYLYGLNLAQAYLVNANLTGANLSNAVLANADMTGATLSNASLSGANIAGANLSGTTSQGNYSGFTSAQLAATASYKSKTLAGTNFSNNVFAGYSPSEGWNFAGQDLTNANFSNCTLSTDSGSTGNDANFTGAIVKGANFSVPTFENNPGGLCINLAQLYSTASYVSGDLRGINLSGCMLEGANLAGQNLSGANLSGTDLRTSWASSPAIATSLTGANLNGAVVNGAHFGGSNLTPQQFYSTASYASKDIRGVDFSAFSLAGWDLSNQKVNGVNFAGTNLTTAQFYSTASYQSGDISGVGFLYNDLTGWDFAGQNVSGCCFADAIFTSAQLYSTASYKNKDISGVDLSGLDLAGWDFMGQIIKGAKFDAPAAGEAALSQSQLYSTASYQAKDLGAIGFAGNDLTGWNFTGQSLNTAAFTAAALNGTNFNGADLSNALFLYAKLTNADLRCATFVTNNGVPVTPWSGGGQADAFMQASVVGVDFRGTCVAAVSDLVGATCRYPILADGTVPGLTMNAGDTFIIRNDPIPITVKSSMSMASGSTLQLQLDGSAWGSTISFASGVTPALGGTLQLTFAPGVNVAQQVGQTFDLFNWTGVTPTGTFIVDGGVDQWDLTHLYTTGVVTLTGGMPGDINGDGLVDVADYNIWAANVGKTGATWSQGDMNGDGLVDVADYNIWAANVGKTASTPEPVTLSLLAFGGSAILRRRK
jgi:uncharacterized protein YjbI with pentapeptide repeats